MRHQRLPASHLLLVLLVMGIWGTNFVFMRWAVDLVPPMTFATLRFATISLTLLLFVARPAVPIRLLLGYGLFSFFAQFALLFGAIAVGMPAGLASLVIQSQVFFTLLFAVLWTQERPHPIQLLGVGVGIAGIATVAVDVGQSSSMLGFVMTIAAAASWASGNMFIKAMGQTAAVPMVTWGSLVAAAALLPLSLILEGTDGWQQVWHHLIEPTPIFWLCLLINAYGASLIGYSGWSWLLRRHAASQVAPFTLLVPVFGLGSAALFLGETISPGKWLGIALVFIGLGLTQAKPGRSDHTS